MEPVIAIMVEDLNEYGTTLIPKGEKVRVLAVVKSELYQSGIGYVIYDFDPQECKSYCIDSTYIEIINGGNIIEL